MFSRCALFWPVLLIIGHAATYNKTCATYRECTGETMQCPNNDPDCDLFVTCDGLNGARKSCSGAVIDCSSSAHCTVNCNGEDSCDDVGVFCPADGVCNINCISEQPEACVDITITSNINTITNINCKGSFACMHAQVYCGNSQSCNLNCYGDNACINTVIHGEMTKVLNITDCYGYNGETCKDLSVYCPVHDENNVPHCFLPGQGIYNSRLSQDGNTVVTDGGINIYAMHSWQDVSITGYTAYNLISGTMHCGRSYAASCPIINDQNITTWNCINDTSLCALSIYVEPTPDPTLEPTSSRSPYPSSNPSMIPTLNPTLHPSLHPSIVQTLNPIISPAINPTLNPSTRPTSDHSIKPSFLYPSVWSSYNPTFQPSLEPVMSSSKKSSERVIWIVIVVLSLLFALAVCCGMMVIWKKYKTLEKQMNYIQQDSTPNIEQGIDNTENNTENQKDGEYGETLMT